MQALIAAWADLVLAKRKWIIACAIALLPLVLLTGGSIPTDNSSERYFVEGDPALQDYDTLIDLFGDNEYLLVGFEAQAAQDIFQPDILNALAQITEFLETHRHVTQVRSLTTYEYLEAEGDDLSTEYLIDDVSDLIDDEGAVEQLKQSLGAEPMALDTLVTRDFMHTRIVARIEHRDDTSVHKVELARELYDFIESAELETGSFQLHLSGYVLVQERLETFAQQDILLLLPIMALVMVAILYVTIRSLIVTLVPWLAIAAGLLLVQEAQFYLGYSHTTVDANALGPTLIIIGIGLTVHVLLDFYYALHEGKDGRQATRSAIAHLWRPAFFTAVTTGAGFYALSVTRIAPIREFALLGAMGALLLFLFSLTVLPACLSYIDRMSDKTRRVLEHGWITRLTRAMPGFAQRHRNAILGLGGVLIAFSLWSIPRISVDTNYLTVFKENSRTRQDIYYFDETYRGTMTLDLVIDSGEDDGVYEPAFLRQIELVQNWLEQRPTTGPVNSLVDFLKEINQSMHFDDPAFYRLPDSRAMVAQYLLLYDSAGAQEDLSDIKDFFQRHTRLVVPVTNMPASEMRQELEEITAFLQDNLGDYQTTITGSIALKTQQDFYVLAGIAQSFLIALTVISVFFVILFKSFKYGLLSIVPSVVPITLAGSLATGFGINLDLSALIVFAMTMGIAVDDAIHVMSRYLLAKQNGHTTHEAIQRAMVESGRAVVFSSIVLVFGFSILSLGTITTIVYVGLFGSVIMALALAGDLLFLPAILYWIDGEDTDARPGASDGATEQPQS